MISAKALLCWLLLALVTAFITNLLYRKGKIKKTTAWVLPFFVFYLSFVLTITILERRPTVSMEYNLQLFWTLRAIAHGNRLLIREIFWNMVLFVPLGGSFFFLTRRRILSSMLAGVLLSAAIEITQLITHRGLFEWDDMVNNGLGTLLGIGIAILIEKACIRQKG